MLARARAGLPDWLWDVVPVVLLIVLGQIDVGYAESEDEAITRIGLLALTLLLLGRRRRPAETLVAMSAVALIAFLVLGGDGDGSGGLPFAFLIGFYTLGRYAEGRAALAAFAIAATTVIALVGSDAQDLTDVFYVPIVVIGTPYGAGRILRNRERQNAELRRLSRELADEREKHAATAVAAERGRIARELHDVVSHSISVIAIQAQAVRRRLRGDQAAEAMDLEVIESTAREAMAEMRRLFGILRTDETKTLAPQPGLGELPALIDQVTDAGLPVELTESGTRAELGPGLDLTAYRIVQESLTNARRHGNGQDGRVRLDWSASALTITVENAVGEAGASEPGAGHGLVGMRERVALYHGSLEHGIDGERFRVRARLPLGNGNGNGPR